MDKFSEAELRELYSKYSQNMKTHGKPPKSYEQWLNFMELINI